MTRPHDSRQSPEVAAVLADLVGDLAFQDDLTGLFNRRTLNLLLRERWQALVSASPRVSLVMLDLDFFKEVNDAYGHLMGDRVLQLAADELRRSFRQGDLLIRYGGDEFVILLPDAEGLEAEALIERARGALERQVPAELGERVEISFSVGTAAYPRDATDPEELLDLADVRLYAEKEARRKARRPPRRLVAGLAAAVGLLGLAAGVFLVWSPPGKPAVDVAPVEVSSAPPSSSQDAPLEDGEADAVREEVRRLEDQVESLRAELERERARQTVPSRPAEDRREREIADLEATIEELRARLSRDEILSAPDPENRAPVPVNGGQGASRPSRRAAGKEPPPEKTETAAPGTPVEVIPPRLVAVQPPEYPLMARRSRRETTVVLRVLVGEDGRVREAEAISGELGLGFGEAAVRAALHAVYEPGTRDGEPVAMEARLRVRFSLE